VGVYQGPRVILSIAAGPFLLDLFFILILSRSSVTLIKPPELGIDDRHCACQRCSAMTVPIPDITVGVLALQGAFSEHIQLLRRATQTLKRQDVKWEFIEVRTPAELARCDALILPGGESTTMSLVAARSGMLEPLRDFVKYVLSMSQTLPQINRRTVESFENPHGALVRASYC
jgi:hypothetical protein